MLIPWETGKILDSRRLIPISCALRIMKVGEVEVGGNAQRHARDIGTCIVLIAVFVGVPLAAGITAAPSLLLLLLGPSLVGWVVGAQVTGYRDIDRWRVFLFGLFVAMESVLLTLLLLVTGAGTLAVFGYGFALLAGVAAVLS